MLNKKEISIRLLAWVFFFPLCFFAQDYTLTGSPINTKGWKMAGDAGKERNFILLTPDERFRSGSISIEEAINLKLCTRWVVEFDFKMDGKGQADGIAFWYLDNPPDSRVDGSGLGITKNAVGFMVGFDIYNNGSNPGGGEKMSKIHIAYGKVANTSNRDNIEFYDVPGSSYHSEDFSACKSNGKICLPFTGGRNYKKVRVTGEVDAQKPGNWIISIVVNGKTLVRSVSLAPAGKAISMTQGYFGFSASTGQKTARQRIKNVKIYANQIPLKNKYKSSTVYLSSDGYQIIDLTQYESEFLDNSDKRYTFEYSLASSKDEYIPITDPTKYTCSKNTDIFVRIRDREKKYCDYFSRMIGLEVMKNSPPKVKDAVLSSCDDGTGKGIFDLTSAAVNEDYTWKYKQYYKTREGAEKGGEDREDRIVRESNYTSVGESDVFVRVLNGVGDFSVAKISLRLIASPKVKDVFLSSCDDGTGKNTFDLTSVRVTDEVKENVSITYVNSRGGNISKEEANSYRAGNGEVVRVRVKDNKTGCTSVAKMVLQVNKRPRIERGFVLESCDLGDGKGRFDLRSARVTSEEGMVLRYYVTRSGAMSGDLAEEIDGSVPYDSVGGVVYVRVENGLTGCYSVADLRLQVNKRPRIERGFVLESCDLGDGKGRFDLRSARVTSEEGMVLRYYVTRSGAMSGDLAEEIDGSVPYDSVGGVVYVRVENGLTGCYSVADLRLQVNKRPRIERGFVLESCDLGDGKGRFDLRSARVTSEEGMVLRYYVTRSGAMSGDLAEEIDGSVPYDSVGGVVYVRVENGLTGCYSVADLRLQVNKRPRIERGFVLESCDLGDGKGRFDLRSARVTSEEGMVLRYYVTRSGAMSGDLAEEIDGSVPYDSVGGVVYVRVENGLTGCYSVADLRLQVNKRPRIERGFVLESCDLGDGKGRFDLRSARVTSEEGMVLRYYVTRSGAMSGDLAEEIDGSVPYDSVGGVVYVRVENGLTGCYSVADLRLQVNKRPRIERGFVLESCDLGDGKGRFDLRSARVTSEEGMVLRYYVTRSGAMSGDLAEEIDGSVPYDSVGGVVYVRVENGLTGCYSVADLRLQVNKRPRIERGFVLESCDLGDGKGRFDLRSARVTSEEGMVLRYYVTRSGAMSGDLAEEIDGSVPYDSVGGVVYVRVENGLTGCYSVADLRLQVNKRPRIERGFVLESCDLGDGKGRFDLRSARVTSEEGMVLRYYVTRSGAMSGDLAEEIDGSVPYDSVGGVVYVRVENGLTGCYSVADLRLQVNKRPRIERGFVLESCDLGDGKGRFDLRSARVTSEEGMVLRYYVTRSGAMSGDLAEEIDGSVPYDSVGGVVYVRVENGLTGCYSVADLRLQVNKRPRIERGFVLESCDLGDGKGRFDLRSARVTSEEGMVLRYYVTRSGAMSGDLAEEIDGSVPYDSVGGVVYVRVENGLTGCYSVADLRLQVNKRPRIERGFVLESCDLGDGKGRFDLRSARVTSEEGMVLRYYVTRSGAMSGDLAEEIDGSVPYDSVGGVVYVRVENGLTGCYSVADLRLQVNKRPRIERGFVLESCDLGDGKGRFDLRSARVTSEEGMVLRYYVTRSGAMSGDLAEEIDGSVPYDSVGGVVYVRVENGLTGCYSVADLRLQVNKRPRIERGFVLESCDLGDGKGRFDLRSARVTSEEGMVLRYYVTRSGAMSGDLAEEIDGSVPYDSVGGVVYVRVENGLTGCYSVADLRLQVNKRPRIERGFVLESCDLGDGKGRFDLRSARVTSEEGMVLRYYVTRSGAMSGDLAEEIDGSVPYDSVGGVVYVRVENGLTGCYSVADLRLQVNKRPRIERGFVLESCDLGDGKGRFDLRSARVTSEEGMVLRYYVTRSGAMSGDLAEEIDGSVPYDSVGGVVYVRVENGLTGCYSVADLRLQVNKRPRIERGFVYTGCDTDFKGYIEVTLSDITPQILKDAEKFEVKYYDSKFSAMLGGDDNLPNKWRYAEDRKVYMRVNSLDGCPYVMESIDFKLGHRLPIEKVEKVSLCSKDPNETSKLLSLSDYVRFFTTDVSVRVRYYDNLWKAQKGREDLGSSWVEAKKGITEYYFRFDKYGVCPQIGRLSIEVKVPERSEILKDQKICTGYTTRLDAGEGFDSYRWSTGATDSSITNVGVGDYWVDLTRNGCTYRQNVQVREVSSPRIGSVSVKDKTVTVEVAGGVPPYEYSLDEVVWQTSNVFHNLYDGNYMIYVRDSSKCNYVTKSHFTIFSLINTITPNGDGFNDYLDYSHLSHKRNFQFYIYDRYGTEIFKGDMFNRYIWDGTIRGRTVSTATYWYTISWSEGSSDTLIRLSSWLLVKNR